MNDEQESRRSFRVSESVYLTYEKLSDLDFESGLAHHKIRSGRSTSGQSQLVDIDARLGEAMYRLGSESELLGRCITMLNDKINVVIEQLPGLKEIKASLAESAPLVCDVGADGIAFPSEVRLAEGDKLYIQMLLAADNRFVESFGRVIRITEPPSGNDETKYPFGIAVEFIGMKPAQRELLIQHMFNRESETLRMRRLQIEQSGD